MTSTKVAAIQLNSQPDVHHSIDKAYRYVAEAANSGAKLICLPENFAFLGDEEQKLEQASLISEVVEELLPAWAKEFEITLVGGGYPVQAGNGKVFNRAIIINPLGEIAASYDKIHLFDVEISESESWKESATVQSGNHEVVVYDTGDLPKIGLSICYDIRFPELYRLMADRGAELILVPAAFTRPTGEAHWEVLLRARAIENSAYVIAPAQTGTHGGSRKTYGHSLIIDPWGKVLAKAGVNPGVISAEINMEYLREVRQKLPSLTHRVL